MSAPVGPPTSDQPTSGRPPWVWIVLIAVLLAVIITTVLVLTNVDGDSPQGAANTLASLAVHLKDMS